MEIDLDTRISAAFTDRPSSEVLEKLIDDVGSALRGAEARHAEARATALAPTTAPADIQKARARMEDAAFERDRLAVVFERLPRLLDEAKHSEEKERDVIEYHAAKEERDALASEIREVYPALSEKLADLLNRLDANNIRIGRLNKKSIGSQALVPAEWISRFPEGQEPPAFQYNAPWEPLLTGVRLPRAWPYENGQHTPYLWLRNS